jgi:hypothetical protein
LPPPRTPPEVTWWLRTASIGYRLYSSYVARWRLATLLREAVLWVVASPEPDVSPRSLQQWLLGQRDVRDFLPLAELDTFYVVLGRILDEPVIQAALEPRVLHRARSAVDHARVHAFQSVAHNKYQETEYANTVHAAIAAVAAGMPTEIELVARWERVQFDTLERPLVEACHLIAGGLSAGSGKRATGVNLMHLIRRSSPHWDVVLRRAVRNIDGSRIYGKELNTCSGILLVGPATATSHRFADFAVPIYDEGGADQCLPGAPRAARNVTAEKLNADEQWIHDNWPSGVRRAIAEELIQFFRKENVRHCLSLPVSDSTTATVIAVVNLNFESDPDLTVAQISRLHDALRPVLDLLGWIETLRHRPRLVSVTPSTQT